MDQFRLDNKVTTARGARVLLADLNTNDAESVAAQLGGLAFAYEADLSQPAHCKNVVAACVQKFGRLDVLINNVGICPRHALDRTSNLRALCKRPDSSIVLGLRFGSSRPESIRFAMGKF